MILCSSFLKLKICLFIIIGRFYWMMQFKESVSQFATENIAPHASKIDHTNYFPKVCMRIYLYHVSERYNILNVLIAFDVILGGELMEKHGGIQSPWDYCSRYFFSLSIVSIFWRENLPFQFLQAVGVICYHLTIVIFPVYILCDTIVKIINSNKEQFMLMRIISVLFYEHSHMDEGLIFYVVLFWVFLNLA